MENPWKIKDSKEVYQNPWIKVSHHEVVNAAGNDGIYGTVHFQNIAIGIVALTELNETFLIGQYRFPLDGFSWEIPEGGGRVGSDPLESAQRELKEETGLVAKDWSELMRIHTSNSVTDELGIIYIARNLTQYEAQPDEDELLEVKRLPFSEALEMVMNGEITDSLSVAAILKTQVLLEKGQL